MPVLDAATCGLAVLVAAACLVVVLQDYWRK